MTLLRNIKEFKAIFFAVNLIIIGSIILLGAERQDFFNAVPLIWEDAIKISGTNVVAGGITIFLLFLLRNWLDFTIIREKVGHIFKNQTQIKLILALFFGAFLLGTALLIFGDDRYFSIYIREGLISIFVVLVMAAALYGLNKRIPTAQKYLNLSILVEPSINMEKRISEIQDAVDQSLLDFDEGIINESQVNEIEQALSLMKWVIMDDKTGLYELQEEKKYRQGLYLNTRSLIKQELKATKKQRNGNQQYEEQLESLLIAQSG